MRRPLVLAPLLLLIATPAAAQYQAKERRCGDVAGGPSAPQNVRALQIPCRPAKRIARRHAARCDLRRRICTVSNFVCTRRFFGNSGTRVTCRHGPQRVRFFYGA